MITYDVTTDELYIQGREEGIKQNMYQMVSKAIEQGILTIEQIAEIVGVTPKQVLKIRDEMENMQQTNHNKQ